MWHWCLTWQRRIKSDFCTSFLFKNHPDFSCHILWPKHIACGNANAIQVLTVSSSWQRLLLNHLKAERNHPWLGMILSFDFLSHSLSLLRNDIRGRVHSCAEAKRCCLSHPTWTLKARSFLLGGGALTFGPINRKTGCRCPNFHISKCVAMAADINPPDENSKQHERTNIKNLNSYVRMYVHRHGTSTKSTFILHVL